MRGDAQGWVSPLLFFFTPIYIVADCAFENKIKNLFFHFFLSFAPLALSLHPQNRNLKQFMDDYHAENMRL